LRNSNIGEYKSLISGSFLTILFSVCASCSSIGFVVISTFGSAGIIATTFLTNYQIPLRLLAVGILIFALYSVSRRTTSNCSLNGDKNNNSS
jgi:hypothetical protein